MRRRKMAEGRHVWSHTETLALIDAWEERYDVLRSQRRTAHVHQDIKEALSALNIDKSIRQIVVKIDNLTQKYRKTKYSGRLNPSWIYFKRLDKFMGGYVPRYRDQVDVTYEKDDIYMDDAPSIDGVNSQEVICNEADSTRFQSTSEPGESVESYEQKLLAILSHQLEVQRQSLLVQEKIVDIMRGLIEPKKIIKTEVKSDLEL